MSILSKVKTFRDAGMALFDGLATELQSNGKDIVTFHGNCTVNELK